MELRLVPDGSSSVTGVDPKLEELALERWLLKQYQAAKTGKEPFKDIVPGEGVDENRVNYCPDWVPAFWAVRDSKGAYKVWELWGIPYYPGLGKVVVGLAMMLIRVEKNAQRMYKEWLAASGLDDEDPPSPGVCARVTAPS